MEEVWKRHPVFYNFEFSNTGRVRNTKTGKYLKGTIAHNGYVRIGIMFKSKKYNKALHRMIMEAFVGFDERQVNHKDGDKTNNHLSNLEYVTNVENIQHAKELGLVPSCEDMYNSMFNNSDIENICECFSKGMGNKETALHLGFEYTDLMKASLSRIRNRTSYVNITKNYEWEQIKQVKYPDTMIRDIIVMILDGRKYKDIALNYPEYDYKKLYNLVKKIGARNIYCELINNIEDERSTTSREA